MKATDLAIRRYPTVFAFIVILTILGIDSYVRLPRESTPDVKIPFVMVMTPYGGASPADVENLVTRKLEQQLKGMQDLRRMTSSSTYGACSILLEFDPKVDMSDALQRVRDRVELAKSELPQDPRDDLLVLEVSASDWPVMQVVLSGDCGPSELKRIGEDLQEEIEQIKGVLGVDLTGGVEHEVRVDVDPERLRFYGLGLPDVQDAVALQNLTIPGGKLALGLYDYKVRVPGEARRVEEILDYVINPGVEPPVYLRDVAQVSFGQADRESISRLNGREAVVLAVKKRTGENVIQVADAVRATLRRVQPSFPAGTEVHIIADHSFWVRQMVGELENNILTGLILVVVVLFAFLGLTNSFFVGVAIPLSMLVSFTVLRALGITLNMVVLFSLILALGMLVDNAIVIVENIYRHRGRGKDAETAARIGTHEVGGAVVSSTLTTLCAFGPLLLWPGIMGEFMSYLPRTVIITLIASLLVALLINPVLCSRFMRPPRSEAASARLGDRLLAFGLRTYEPTLVWALRHRGRVLLGMLGLLIAVFALFARFNHGVELFPDTDPTFAMVNIEAPSGTRLEVTDLYARRAEDATGRIGDLTAYVTRVGTEIGTGLADGGEVPSHKSRITLEFVDSQERSRSSLLALQELRELLGGFTGARITVEKEDNGPPTGKPVNIEISGDNFVLLGELASEVKELIRSVPGLVDIHDDFDRSLPEIEIRPDFEKAGRYGLQTWDIAGTVRTALHGAEMAKFRQGEDEYDIVVRYEQPFRRQVEDLENLTVFHEGQSVPLGAFATATFGSGLAAIHRIDARRVVTVSAEAAPGWNGNALLAEVRKRLAELPVPPGYSIDYTGESEDQQESQAFLSDAFMIAVMLIFLVLITQFGSITVPLIILSSVVLSLIGVLLGLLVTGTAFGIIMTGVGVISLAGVVVNNAIVLLTYTGQLREQGLPPLEAIILAGKTRFRPVILTAVTTILGLVPLTTGFSLDFGRLFAGDFGRVLALGGESSQWWGPMGVAVISGLAVATFLTLIVVPVMYSSLDPAKARLRGVLVDSWRRPRRRPQEEPVA